MDGASAQSILSAFFSDPSKILFVAFAQEKGLSQRHACRAAGLARSTARYQPEAIPRDEAADEAALVERLHSFAKKRRRRGYRLTHQELQRAAMVINHDQP
jgi:putative transposase